MMSTTELVSPGACLPSAGHLARASSDSQSTRALATRGPVAFELEAGDGLRHVRWPRLNRNPAGLVQLPCRLLIQALPFVAVRVRSHNELPPSRIDGIVGSP